MIELVRLPYLGTAEEDVLFVEWYVEVGEPVHKGQALAIVETLKATFEVEADRSGVLLSQLASARDRVPVQAAVGVIGAEGDELDQARLAELVDEARENTVDASASEEAPPASGSTPTRSSGDNECVAAPAARKRARELGIDLASVRGGGAGGLIRVVDIEEAHAKGASGASVEANGELDRSFLELLRADTSAFAGLSSDAKVALYRKHGALIGADCHIGAGTVLVAERLVLGDGAYFGDDCSLEARDFEAGVLMRFGTRSKIRCARVRLGDNAFFTEDVEIGGGGAMDPEAELAVGSHGFVGERVHLNPCRPLRLGDEVVVSRNAVLMTHSFGGSILAGYPNRFAGITIGDGAQIGIGAVLFPGVEVGAGAVLLSGSSLVSSVPPGRLFGGVPAVDLKAAATPLSPEEFRATAEGLIHEFARQLRLRDRELTIDERETETRVTVHDDGREHHLRFSSGGFTDLPEAVAEEVRVATAFEPSTWDALAPDITAIDLSVPAIRGPQGPLSDALREFLRKRGVRLRPRAWAYRGGWL